MILEDITLTTGGNIPIYVDTATRILGPNVLYYRVTGTQTLSSNFALVATGTATDKQRIVIFWEANATLSGNSVVIMGTDAPEALSTKDYIADCLYNGSAWNVKFLPDFQENAIVETADIADEAVTVDKMADLTRGSIITGQGAGNRPTALDAKSSGYILVGDGTDLNSVAQSGDVIFSTAGVSAIQAGVIVNADVNASAAIAFSKLASLSSANILVGSAGNVATSVAMSGDATISNTGALSLAAGSVDVAELASDLQKEVITVYIAFDNAAKVGDYKIRIPYDCEMTHMSAAAVGSFTTDNATITPKNNAGTIMKLGAVNAAATIPSGTTIGTVVDQIIDTDNAFTAGQTLTLTTAKVTKDGQALVTIELTRV